MTDWTIPPDKAHKLGVIEGGDDPTEEPIEPLVQMAPYKVVDGLPCRHRTADIDVRGRAVLCRECGASLDPIEFLAQIGREFSQQVAARQQAERQTESAHRRLEAVERDLKRMQARRSRERKRVVQELAWDGDTIDLPLTLADVKRLWSGIHQFAKLSEYRHLAALLVRAVEINPKVQEAQRGDGS